MLQRLTDLCRKNKEVLLYLVFGVLTTVVSMIVFWLFAQKAGLPVLAANVVSWVAAVTFAFFTNRKWVFNGETSSSSETIKQAVKFYSGRLATLAEEELILWLFIDVLSLPMMPVKLAAQFVVVASNYVISKLFVFKKQ